MADDGVPEVKSVGQVVVSVVIAVVFTTLVQVVI